MLGCVIGCVVLFCLVVWFSGGLVVVVCLSCLLVVIVYCVLGILVV